MDDAEEQPPRSESADRALFIFSEDNTIRKSATWLIAQRWFDWAILGVILANCVLLAMLDPVDPNSATNKVIEGFEIPFLVIFAAEMCLKIVAKGFMLSPTSYVRDGWNVLDMIVVVASLVSVASGVNVSAIRAIRVLRPLRTVSRFPRTSRPFPWPPLGLNVSLTLCICPLCQR